MYGDVSDSVVFPNAPSKETADNVHPVGNQTGSLLTFLQSLYE
jgi:hypothetical protein